jgi:DNA repair exonuclease SbcCD ATPase subunit
MKYIKNYKNYFLSENLETNSDDSQSTKMAKEKLNDLKEKISEYNSKKSKIDNIYKSSKDSEELKRKMDDILGKESQGRNKFLVLYSSIASKKRTIENTKTRINDKEIELSRFKQKLKIGQEAESANRIKERISEIQDSIKENKRKIQEDIKKISDMEKDLSDIIKKSEEDMKKWIEDVSK